MHLHLGLHRHGNTYWDLLFVFKALLFLSGFPGHSCHFFKRYLCCLRPMKPPTKDAGTEVAVSAISSDFSGVLRALLPRPMDRRVGTQAPTAVAGSAAAPALQDSSVPCHTGADRILIRKDFDF